MTRIPEKNIETKRQISYEEAHQIAQRFIDEFFHNPGRDRPRIGIPARPEYDDDICLHSFIDQQKARVAISDHTALIRELRDALKPFDLFLTVHDGMGGTTPHSGSFLTVGHHKLGDASLDVEHLRAARAALRKANEALGQRG